jgi:hypothetical protein
VAAVAIYGLGLAALPRSRLLFNLSEQKNIHFEFVTESDAPFEAILMNLSENDINVCNKK